MEDNKNVDFLKICILGHGEVGKTSFIKRAVEGIFVPLPGFSIQVDFLFLKTEIIDPLPNKGDLVKIVCQMRDFGRENRFRLMLPRFCKGCVGALLLFDSSR